jgi:hypothetical protein
MPMSYKVRIDRARSNNVVDAVATSVNSKW